ncbi:MAG: hypothetical protein AAGC44_07310 [Planctomycetota bacterium]
MKRLFYACFYLLFSAALLPLATAQAEPVRVEVQQTEDGWRLLRGGEPFQIKGAGGDQYLDQLVAAGGNSIRTWGVGPETRDLLDEAHRRGLTVTVGVWLGHERHGFDYNNLDQVAEQFAQVRAAVEQHKDHPALLAWGIGNEMEGFAEGDNPAIWSHVEACAALVKRLDPNHPTMTVIAEVGGRKVESIHVLCPSIDIVGINSYAGGASIPKRYVAAGGTKPYIVTEFGPAGAWEVGLNDFGAPYELTSSAKAGAYADVYRALATDPNCLGSYAFLWGSKVEATTTWFGMFLADGSRLGAVDAMTRAWSGQSPDDLCPVIDSLELAEDYEQQPGARITVALSAVDPEGSELSVEWSLMRDSTTYLTGGDFVEAPPSYPEHIVSSDTKGCTLTLPEEYGVFRVYAVVRDEAGNAAIANLPLFAGNDPDAPADGGVSAAPMTPGRAAQLPMSVYTDADAASPWIASGYMGNARQIVMDPNHTQAPRSGQTCLRVQYRAPDEWGGVVWQDPPNDWGDLAGGFDLRGATALEFWARGAQGGEVVSFGFGVLGSDKPFADSGSGSLEEVKLTDDWRRYRVEIGSSVDLQRIKTGFFWTVAGQGEPIIFYLDDIRFIQDEAE